MQETYGIVERHICKVSSITVVFDEWQSLAAAVQAEAKHLGHPTASCAVEKHLMHTSVLRLSGVGDVDDTLVDGCRRILRRKGLTGRVEVCRPIFSLTPMVTTRRWSARRSYSVAHVSRKAQALVQTTNVQGRGCSSTYASGSSLEPYLGRPHSVCRGSSSRLLGTLSSDGAVVSTTSILCKACRTASSCTCMFGTRACVR